MCSKAHARFALASVACAWVTAGCHGGHSSVESGRDTSPDDTAAACDFTGVLPPATWRSYTVEMTVATDGTALVDAACLGQGLVQEARVEVGSIAWMVDWHPPEPAGEGAYSGTLPAEGTFCDHQIRISFRGPMEVFRDDTTEPIERCE